MKPAGPPNRSKKKKKKSSVSKHSINLHFVMQIDHYTTACGVRLKNKQNKTKTKNEKLLYCLVDKKSELDIGV